MSRLLLAFYYLVVVPLALLRRVHDRRRRELRIDRDAPTYWARSESYGDFRSQR